MNVLSTFSCREKEVGSGVGPLNINDEREKITRGYRSKKKERKDLKRAGEASSIAIFSPQGHPSENI